MLAATHRTRTRLLNLHTVQSGETVPVMGMIRKTLSVSTLGLVKYTSKREALTKQASAQARLARAETRAVRRQVRRPKD